MANSIEHSDAGKAPDHQAEQASVRLLNAASGDVIANIPLASKVDTATSTDRYSGDSTVTLSFFSNGGRYTQLDVGLGKDDRYDYEIVQPHNPAQPTSKPDGLHHLYLLGESGNVISHSEIKGWMTEKEIATKNGDNRAMEVSWTDTHNMDHHRMLKSERFVVSEKPLHF